MIDAADKRGELLKHRRKSFLEALVLLARQPDGGNNLHLATRRIEEFLEPLALKAAQRSELEWMQEAVVRQKQIDPSVGRLFEDIQDLIEVHLRKLDED
jgi:hypothetical protein